MRARSGENRGGLACAEQSTLGCLAIGEAYEVPDLERRSRCEARDRHHRVRDGLVPIAFFFADHEKALARRKHLCDDRSAGHKTHDHRDG